jgi:uncharacterized protein YcbK (DUF882 family)
MPMFARLCLAAALVAVVPGEAIPLAPITGKTAGLHPTLTKRLRSMSANFGRTIEVTSGCRTRSNNHGVKNSYHLRCMAADVRMQGVATAKIVNYWRVNGGGGTGTYGCSPPHVDIGPSRSWYWPCRGRKHARH